MSRFDGFIAIDWSGATGRYTGVAVAECGPGRSSPRLISPDAAGRWTREGVFDWIGARLGGSERLLIGIDCAFSLPWSRASAYGVDHAPALWRLVDDVCDGAPDHFGGPFASHADYAEQFWSVGKAPTGYEVAHRRTELACREHGLGTPESPYKLIGPKQVGKGALAGMRLLNRLRREHRSRLAVWPFEEADGTSVAVEIYPRLFLKKAGFGSSKVRTVGDLNACLATFGSDPFDSGACELTDHETDALVSAAGLRLLAGEPELWRIPAMQHASITREGWIFGVPHSAAAQ